MSRPTEPQGGPAASETLSVLTHAVQSLVAVQHVTTLEQLDRAQQLSSTDALTGLPNRRAWDAALAAATTGGTPPTILVLDLDGLKSCNDEHGHASGDELLRTVSSAWLRMLRDDDLLARIGGDEFAVLLDQCSTVEANVIAERLRMVAEPWGGVSVGLAFGGLGEKGAMMQDRADAALYDAKRTGRNRVTVAAAAVG